jgi:hypothetical protein
VGIKPVVIGVAGGEFSGRGPRVEAHHPAFTAFDDQKGLGGGGVQAIATVAESLELGTAAARAGVGILGCGRAGLERGGGVQGWRGGSGGIACSLRTRSGIRY